MFQVNLHGAHVRLLVSRFFSGWTIFDNLYILNRTMFIVSDQPEAIPNRTYMISRGIPMKNGPGEREKRLPTDEDMRIISTGEAKKLFRESAGIIDGVSVSFRPLTNISCADGLPSGLPMTPHNCASLQIQDEMLIDKLSQRYSLLSLVRRTFFWPVAHVLVAGSIYRR